MALVCENDALLNAAQFEAIHGYNRGDVLLTEDGKTAMSVLVHRTANGLNTETASTLDYGKSSVASYNEGLRSALQQNLPVRVCAVVSKQGHSTYYDRGMFQVTGERLFSFYLEKVGSCPEKDVATPQQAKEEPLRNMHGKPWNLEDDKLLSAEHALGTSMSTLEGMLGRKSSAIKSRLEQHVRDKAIRKRLGACTNRVVVVPVDVLPAPVVPVNKRPLSSPLSAEPVHKKRRFNNDAAAQHSIVTHYDGNIFRSRHEARFAYMLNQLSVQYEYEGTTFDMKTGVNKRYTPDFYLPALNTWVELKPAYPHWEEMVRCAELCARGFPTVLMYGDGYAVPFGYDTHGGGSGGSGYTHSRGLKGMSWDRTGARLPGELAFTYAEGAVKIQPCNALQTIQAAAHPVLKAAYDATVRQKFE